MTRRTFAALIFTGAIQRTPRDVPILSGVRVSGRTDADVDEGFFDLARRTAIVVPPDSDAHRALRGLLGQKVDVFMRVRD